MAASKEYLKRIDEKNYLTEREHREYLRELEKKLEVLEILKPYLRKVLTINESISGIDMHFLPTTFIIAKVMELDFNFKDTQEIENIRKVKEWLGND